MSLLKFYNILSLVFILSIVSAVYEREFFQKDADSTLTELILAPLGAVFKKTVYVFANKADTKT